jgi:predicted nucleotidyltransferase component of viral defense system
MFPAAVFQPDWVNQQRRQLGNCDPAILEKCVHALTLLGYLVESGLPFIFKGGTSLLLHMPQVRRLSRDIDIVCGRPAADGDAVRDLCRTLCRPADFSFQLSEFQLFPIFCSM